MAIEHIKQTTVENFAEQVHGQVLQPGDDGYDEARTVWNAMIDEKPAVIVKCAGVADVMAAVDFARDLDLLLSVKGGGHNVAGRAVCDGGLMIDLGGMDGVRVDPETETARVGAGATWGDFDHETQAFGLATTGGIVSTTGVAGLTLGGGFGYLHRKYGLASDNLRSIDVVTADGELVHASPDENPDLFWGMRGGGGNFGIATSFEFDLHEVGPEVLAGRLVYPCEAAPEVFRFNREFMADAPNEVMCYPAFVQGNPAVGHPEIVEGETLFGLLVMYSGDISEGREVLRPLREFAEPLSDTIGPTPYTEHQHSSDELYQEGHRNYWKSHYYHEVSDDFIETVMEHVDPLPSPFTTVYGEWMGGATAEAELDATAFPHRDKTFLFTIAPKWSDPQRDDELIEWAQEFHDALTPYAADGVYMNYLERDEDERIGEAYGKHHERLRELKSTWDPENVFRMNQNITPAE